MKIVLIRLPLHLAFALACGMLVSVGNAQQMTRGLASSANRAVAALERANNGRCPCFDDEDLQDFIDNAPAPTPAMCTYQYDTDRRLRLSTNDAGANLGSPAGQIFTRPIACYGPKVEPGGSDSGLPPVGGYAISDNQGQACFRLLLQVADENNIDCKCVSTNSFMVGDCPANLG